MDHESEMYLIRKSNPQKYTETDRIFYKICSHIVTFFFLTILMILSLLNSLINYIIHSKKNQSTMRYSKDELKLVPSLSYYFSFLNLNIEAHEVTTKDGYVITLQHITSPKESQDEIAQRPPILLLHGLLQSSGSFCSSGKQSLAYYFHQQGYDVWLGNNRCGFTPKNIEIKDTDWKFWDWDLREMSEFDVGSLLDYVIDYRKIENHVRYVEKVILIAHSQGTAQGFINIAGDPYNNCSKIKAFVALSPAVYGGKLLSSLVIRIMGWGLKHNWVFGIESFLGIMMDMRKLMIGWKIFGFFSYSMFNFLFNWNDSLWDLNIKNRHFLFSPVYISTKLMKWWLGNEGIRGGILPNDEEWFNENSPPIFLVVPKKDELVDGERLIQHFIEFEISSKWTYLVLEEYEHLDVLWSKDVIDDIGVKVVKWLNELEEID